MRLGIDASNIRGGGGVTHLAELLMAADPAKHGATRVAIWAGRQTLAQLPDRPWLDRVHAPQLDEALPRRLSWRRRELPRMASEACDLLFVPGGGYTGAFRPYVTMSRNMLPFEPREMFRYGLSWMTARLLMLRLAQARSFSNAAGIIFLNEYARTTVTRVTGRLGGQTTIIPHGIDARFRLSPRPQRPMTSFSRERPFRFLYVSIIDVYKHQWHVADAVARLRGNGMPVALDLVGPAYGPAMRRLRKTMRRIDPRGAFIHYHGPLPFAALAERYQAADAFVFASTCENMPNILVEAMAAGLPIACLRRDPMPEVLADAGVYFDDERPETIASALARFCEDAALRERSARLAFQRAHQYSWTRCAAETFAFLAQVESRRVATVA